MSEHQAESTLHLPPQPAPLNCLLAALQTPEHVDPSNAQLSLDEVRYADSSRYTRTPDLIAFAAMRHLGTPIKPGHVQAARNHDIDQHLIAARGVELPKTIHPAHRSLARLVLPYFSAYGIAKEQTEQFHRAYARPNGTLRIPAIIEDLYEGPMEGVHHPILDILAPVRKLTSDRSIDAERAVRYIMLTQLHQEL